jgi:hypothetical protein
MNAQNYTDFCNRYWGRKIGDGECVTAPKTLTGNFGTWGNAYDQGHNFVNAGLAHEVDPYTENSFAYTEKNSGNGYYGHVSLYHDGKFWSQFNIGAAKSNDYGNFDPRSTAFGKVAYWVQFNDYTTEQLAQTAPEEEDMLVQRYRCPDGTSIIIKGDLKEVLMYKLNSPDVDDSFWDKPWHDRTGRPWVELQRDIFGNFVDGTEVAGQYCGIDENGRDRLNNLTDWVGAGDKSHLIKLTVG